jgi:hypothetical protein
MTESPWGPPLDVLPALAREEQSLIDVLGSEKWTPVVHDLAAGILGDKLRRLSSDRDGHDAPPDDGEWLVACRQLSPEVLFALLVDSNGQLVDLWKKVDLDEVRDGVPRWLTTAREYAGYWVRHQLIRDELDLPLLDEATFLAPVVDTLLRSLPFALRDIVVPKGKRVAITLTGPAGGTWSATRTADDWVLDQRPPPRSPYAGVTTDPHTLWRLSTGNLRLADARAHVTVAGDSDTCEALLRAL